MRKLILAATMAAIAVPIALTPAAAQSGRNERREARECQRELRDADTRREYRQERRECARELSQARARDWRTYNRYDYNRPPEGGAYYADDYYRDGRYYRERRLSANDRIYRGRDGRNYCRRNDGTTGLIIGAGAGALIGHALDDGRSSTLGTILGAVAGGAIGREVDRDNGRRDLRCR
ncbi:MAG TPA: glycine zipper 2TM domain-containing protein [Allosphingosinicella sp.]|nr:glycine zipper 2TM domain-containing protein [Allosphingosinicella sp.]